MAERIISNYKPSELDGSQILSPLKTAYTFVGALPVFNYRSKEEERGRASSDEQDIDKIEATSVTEVIIEE